MIRSFETEDLPEVMRIWLETNIQAHNFIDKQYWIDNFDEVKELIPSSEVYVFENEAGIDAFVGLNNGYIAGIFVTEMRQSKGIGRQLLEKCKELYSKLTLNVYEKNKQAVSFYMREGFVVEASQIDEKNGETELSMIWTK